ncbi:MAG: YidB family protein [Phyllobacteriaceae bacterium]|nr:YidB family protein [Phyllobacteriaceae bacterium]
MPPTLPCNRHEHSQYGGFQSEEMMMAKTNTMLKALLGLAVVAGWQNRDKIGDFVKNMGGQASDGENPAGGLGGLIDSFKKAGLGEKADSWVSTGENKPVSAPEVEKGVGGDMIDALAAQTGLSREELLKRLAEVLPGMVDKLTPSGKLPG